MGLTVHTMDNYNAILVILTLKVKVTKFKA